METSKQKIIILMRKAIELQEDPLIFCNLEVTQFKELYLLKASLKEEGERF